MRSEEFAFSLTFCQLFEFVVLPNALVCEVIIDNQITLELSATLDDDFESYQ
jgi:hypothetical protein